MRKNDQLTLISALLLLLSGCATNELSQASGNGAVAIPLTYSNIDTQRFSCKKVGLKLNDTIVLGYLSNVKQINDDDYEGYLLIDRIPPGNHLLSEIICYAHNGSKFNGYKNQLAFFAYENVAIEPNTILIAPFSIEGYTKRDYEMKWFHLKTGYALTVTREAVQEDIEANKLKPNWTIRNINLADY